MGYNITHMIKMLHPSNHSIDINDIDDDLDEIRESNFGPVARSNNYHLMCATCKKIFTTNPELRGKIIGGGMWKCDNCLNPPKPEVTEYKISGSPDIYAVHYHKTNHIVKTAKDYDIEKIKDIRQADLDGKFGFPSRYRQIRDLY